MRINKALALAGIASRRTAEKIILNREIMINGQITTDLATILKPSDEVQYNGKNIYIPFENKEYTYILMNKPIEVLCTTKDPENRKTILCDLPKELREKRLYPIGRLDYYSEGLIIITDDGTMTHMLTHPKYHIEKVYHVTIRGTVSQAILETFRQGIELSSGEQLAPIPTRVLSCENNRTMLELTLSQGINRQIRTMCDETGLTILRLMRIQIGNLNLYNTHIKKGDYNIVDKNFLQKEIGF
ncbi:MAG: pseudouridine synthase [Desulfovibrionaceae bacterium]